MPNIIAGLLAIALGSWGLATWWWSVAELLRGIVPLVLIMIGFVALGAGVSNGISLERGNSKTKDDEVDEELMAESKLSDEPQSTAKPQPAPKTEAVAQPQPAAKTEPAAQPQPAPKTEPAAKPQKTDKP